MPTDAELLVWMGCRENLVIVKRGGSPQWQLRDRFSFTGGRYGRIIGEGDTLREALTRAMEAHPNE